MAAIPSQIPGYRLFPGELVNSIITPVNNMTGNGTPQAATFNGITISGTFKEMPQFLTAAGATQGNATPITSALAVVNVATTVSTHGVKLPVASTGLEVTVCAAGSFGVKVYPFAGAKIGAANTNVADTTLAVNKSNTYIAVSGTKWVVQRGN